MSLSELGIPEQWPSPPEDVRPSPSVVQSTEKIVDVEPTHMSLAELCASRDGTLCG